MGVNKVIYGDTPIVDLTDSTVTPQNLLAGEVAYSASGNRIVGEVVTTTVVPNPTGTPTDELNTIQIGSNIYEIPLKDKNLPYNCKINSDYIDKELLEYFLGRIKTVYNVDLHNKYFIVSLGYGTSWWDYSSFIDSPAYTFYVPDSTLLSSDGLLELAFSTGKDFSNFELYNSDCYFTAPQYSHITCYSFLAKTIGQQLDNGWDLSTASSGNTFQLFGDSTPYHISNAHYDMYVNVRYPIYVSRPFYTEDSNNVKKCILEGDFALINLNDVNVSNLTNGQTLVFNSATNKWENVSSTSGGHTILDDNGTSLTQESSLQFKGTYSHDDSTNGKTIVEVTRSMTRAEFDQLTPAEKKGIISITNESGLPWKDITGVLPAGETEIILSDNVITDNSTFEAFTDPIEVSHIDMVLVNNESSLINDILTGEDNTKVTASSNDTVEVVPWKAFDGTKRVSSGTYASPYYAWLAGNGDAPCWLQYHFDTAKYIDEVKAYVYCNNGTYTGSAKIQGSNDGTSWTDISSAVSISAPYGEEIELDFTCDGNQYTYVRLYSETAFTVYGGASIFVGEMEIYGRSSAKGIKLTFPVQAENLNVKVRIS